MLKIPSKIHSSGYYTNPERYFIKYGVEIKEYKIHKYVYDLHIVPIPNIMNYDKTSKIMVLQKITGCNLSDFYGENSNDIPTLLFEKVRDIVKILMQHDIEYPDITGYNFMLDNNGKVWIVDFEHATYGKIQNTFVKQFCDDTNKILTWNPDFM